MDITQYWDGWDPIVHTLITVTVGYIALLIMLRISGPRTMASMTPLDVIVAVTLGSAFGRTVTAKTVPLAQVLVAIVVLVGLQWFFGWLRRRSPKVRSIMDSPPILLYYQGQFQSAALRRHQLVEDDVHTAARQSGHGSLNAVAAVILQQDGSLGVITEAQLDTGESLLPFTQESPERRRDLGDHGERR